MHKCTWSVVPTVTYIKLCLTAWIKIIQVHFERRNKECQSSKKYIQYRYCIYITYKLPGTSPLPWEDIYWCKLVMQHPKIKHFNLWQFPKSSKAHEYSQSHILSSANITTQYSILLFQAMLIQQLYFYCSNYHYSKYVPYFQCGHLILLSFFLAVLQSYDTTF